MRTLVKAAIATSLLFYTITAGAANGQIEIPVNRNIPFADKALEMFKKSISIRTVKGYGKVPELANYLADELRAGGFPDRDIHVIPHGETAVLIARYRGDGSSGKKPISIVAHMDVVEAFPKDWERDPFTLIEENGFFYGRGILDNKMGMVVAVTTFLRLKAEGYVPSRDLILAFSGDEETDMITTRALVNEHRALTDSEFMLNTDVGEGTLPEAGGPPASFNMQAAEKTYATFEITARNPGGHSSLPREDNAIYDLADAIKRLQAYKFPVMQDELTKAFFMGTSRNTAGDLGSAMLAFANNPEDEWAVKTLRADPAYVGIVSTTCVPTMLGGGHAENALPQSATATVNCRIFPGEGADLTLARLKKTVANDTLEFKLLDEVTESGASPLRGDIVSALQKAVDTRYPGLMILPAMSAGATDGMHFRAAGIPSYGVNAVYIKSSDEFSHGLNERLPVDSFYGALTHWHVLLTELTR